MLDAHLKQTIIGYGELTTLPFTGKSSSKNFIKMAMYIYNSRDNGWYFKEIKDTIYLSGAINNSNI
jgi:hypothetical protein